MKKLYGIGLVLISIQISKTSSESEHYFSLPDSCRTNSEISANATTKNSWICMWYDWKSLSCWFDLEKIFDVPVDPRSTVDIYSEVNGYIYTFNEEVTGRCFQIINFTDQFGYCFFNITLNNRAGGQISKSINFNSRNFVKPAMPSRTLQYNNSETCINLSWVIQKFIYGREIRFRYRSRYNIEQTYSWQEQSQLVAAKSLLDIFDDPSISEYGETLVENLTAFTVYDIKMDIIFNENGTRKGFWSDTLDITVTTLDDVPEEVPIFLPGFFSQINTSSVRIFWQPSSPIKTRGIITNYRVRVNKTASLISPERTSYVVSCSPTNVCGIGLSQKTRHGFPNISDAKIFVFPEDDRPEAPLYVVESVNDSKVIISWDFGGVKNTTRHVIVMIVWCIGTLPGLCFEPLHYKLTHSLQSITMTSNTEEIDLEEGKFSDYIYGLSVEAISKDDEKVNSGIKWYKGCLYEQNTVPNVPLNVMLSIYEGSKVLIKWEPYSCLQNSAVIKNYVVRYCEPVQMGCIEKMVSPSIHAFMLDDLKPGHNYKVDVGTKLKHGGNGPWSISKNITIPKQNLPRNYKAVLMFTSIGVGVPAFFAILLIIICCWRRYSRKANDEMKNIELPKIQPTVNSKNNLQISEKKNNNSADSGIGGSKEFRNSQCYSKKITDVSEFKNNCDGHFKRIQSEDVPKQDIHDIDHSSRENNELDSGGYRDVDFESSEYEDSETSSSPLVHVDFCAETPNGNSEVAELDLTNDKKDLCAIVHTIIPNKNDNTIDSYCEQGIDTSYEFISEEQQSEIDSYCHGGFTSSS